MVTRIGGPQDLRPQDLRPQGPQMDDSDGSQPAHQIGVHGVHLIPCIVSWMLQAPGALHRQRHTWHALHVMNTAEKKKKDAKHDVHATPRPMHRVG